MGAQSPGPWAPKRQAMSIKSCAFVHDRISITLETNTVLERPLDDFPKLKAATPEQRDDWRIIGPGVGLRWPSLDEDISLKGFLSFRGREKTSAVRLAAPRSPVSGGKSADKRPLRRSRRA